MKVRLMPKQKDILFVSDLHIESYNSALGKKFSLFLSQIDPEKVSHFIVLGDLFDFCFGRIKYFKKKYHEIGKDFESLANKGVEVLYVQGNHEFSIEKIGWQNIKFISNDTHILKLNEKTKLNLTHGDKLIAPKKYFFYMRIVRSNIFQFLASLFPGSLMDKICISLSKFSRSSHKNRTLDKTRLFNAAIKLQEKQGSTHTILGHFHVPWEKTYTENGTIKQIFILDSWAKPNYLRYNGECFSRHPL